MSEKRGRSRINASAKWKLIIFLECVAFLQLVESKDLSVRENLKDCGGEFSGYQYVITSPNYPAPYPRKQNCIFTLRGSPLATCDQTFNLQFLDFSLSPSENCAEDYLEIGDRSLFCGKVVGIRKYASKDNTLVLRFRSGASLGDKGFRILVTTLPCSPEQINEKTREREKLEQSGTTLGNPVTDKYLISGNAASQKDSAISLSSYRQFVRGEIPSPPKVESLVESEEKDLLREHEPKFDGAPVDHLEVPVNGIHLFRASTSLKTDSATPSTVQSIEDKPSKISSYLFVPPTEFRPPNQWNTQFQDQKSNSTKNLPLLQGYQGINDKFGIPAKTYGVPDLPYYPPLPNSVPGIKTGEVLDNPGGWIDCQGKPNLQPDLEVATTFRGNGNRGLINNFQGQGQGFGAPLYPSTTYPLPNPFVPNQNSAFNPNPQYGLPPGGYPNGNLPGLNGLDRPIYPPNNFNGYQNFIPNSGGPANYYPVLPNPANNGQLALCCNVFYSGQRFLLTSPGFPSASYSANPFECAYSIIPYSANTCSMRFNFKFFNHGTEDAFCSNGHIEIDGRRFCGCKKGLSVVSIVTSAFPKIIRFRYTGYPRTKFNGFLIEVIQEACPNNPGYLSRSKKEIGSSSGGGGRSLVEKKTASENSTAPRARRDLGYSYPKPIFGLVEEPGSGQSWKSGYTPRGQAWAQEGPAANLLSPLFSCQAFSFLDWIHAAKEAYLRNGRCIGTNSPSGNIPDTIVPVNPGTGGWNHPCSNCEDINVVEGIISSPQYPTNYPHNVRKCFRFFRAPESCYLELVIFDFDLEHSNGCTKDYVTFSGSSDRYCGISLAGKRTSFDISRGQSLVMCFVTDGYGSRRGFSAGFSQIPCQGLGNR